jgi:hypothetical protein
MREDEVASFGRKKRKKGTKKGDAVLFSALSFMRHASSAVLAGEG